MTIEEKTMSEEKKDGWNALSEEERRIALNFAEEYIHFLNRAKTEREAVSVVREMAESAGFQPLEKMESLNAGDKVYTINKGKSMFLAVIGSQDLTQGARVIGAHLDSPRLDLKQIPLYEDGQLALFKTHYYGGIKKYQWTAIPLSLHGIVVKDTGETVHICIGEDEKDPVFTITDLLPHLGAQQGKKTLSAGIAGEDLNILAGSLPLPDADKEAVKGGILKLLKDRYGISEEDFASAEIEVVPAMHARSLGFDESLIAGYGQEMCIRDRYNRWNFRPQGQFFNIGGNLREKSEIRSSGPAPRTGDNPSSGGGFSADRRAVFRTTGNSGITRYDLCPEGRVRSL